jgi:spore maturation protein CgeB
MKLVVFGLTVSSAWGNGHATTYRALLSAFRRRGHEVVFYEWNAPWYRGEHRDLPAPDFCKLVLYERWERSRERAVREARDADAVIVGSYVDRGPEVIDALLEDGVEQLFYYDIDTPVTVGLLAADRCAYLRRDQVPCFRRYLSFTGGPFLERVVEGELGAREARPLYCSVDGARHRPAAADGRYRADLAYLGTYAPDRQEGLERFLLEPARRRPDRRFLVGGPQYPDTAAWPRTVRHVEHVAPMHHAAFYGTPRWQLNLTRADMRAAGWSPSVRLFEAAACGAAMMSDRWDGIDELFEPGREILLPGSTEEVLTLLDEVHDDDRRSIGAAARERVLREHSCERRAEQLEALLDGTAGGCQPRAAAGSSAPQLTGVRA